MIYALPKLQQACEWAGRPGIGSSAVFTTKGIPLKKPGRGLQANIRIDQQDASREKSTTDCMNENGNR
jgi:hypothetical protein